jgi:REP element-mobilizing transposase RayT
MDQRKPNRLKNYDYSQNGYYFVTICTRNRQEWFGKIKNGVMELNRNGEIVEKQWKWLAKQYSDIELDVYEIMPNHVHGIIRINVRNGREITVGNGRDRSLHRKIKSLPELIGAFKTTSSKMIHNNGVIEFRWQKSFYDHVIRNELSLNRIREYIKNNPRQWDSDRENIKNRRIAVRNRHACSVQEGPACSVQEGHACSVRGLSPFVRKTK